MHEVAPLVDEYKPLKHSVHESALSIDEAKPGTHFIHELEAAPAEYVPVGHATQIDETAAPVDGEYLPGGQDAQVVDSKISENMPAGQLRHVAALRKGE